jgi:DNA-binding transcriptional MerR regulator
MFSIGEFARHGRVSVRMLRHYDAIGLLRPASVDAATGYRFYRASQLAELNRIIALKDLGFTLLQVQAILAEQVSAAELRGMLKLRRAEIFDRIEAETARLARVEARLLTIEDEARVPVDGVVIKHLAPVRVGELTGTRRRRKAAIVPSDMSGCPRFVLGQEQRAKVGEVGRQDRAGRDGHRVGHAAGEHDPAPLDGQAAPAQVVGGQGERLGRVALHRRAGGRVHHLPVQLQQARLEPEIQRNR